MELNPKTKIGDKTVLYGPNGAGKSYLIHSKL